MKSVHLLLTLLCVSASLREPSLAAPADTRPNIVVVFIDDMGWSDFSCFDGTVEDATCRPAGG